MMHHRVSKDGVSSDESGSILIITLLVLLAISSIGVGLIVVAGSDLDVSANVKTGEQAVYYADAGLQKVLSSFDPENSGSIPSGFNVTMTEILNETVKDPTNAPVFGASYVVKAEMDVGSSGFSIECNIPGYSLDYGQRRFHLISTGIGPGGTTRELEAVILTKPSPGLCPPGLGEQHQ